MDTEDAWLLVAVADGGSIASGARSRHIAASVASRRIARLEAALGVQIFNRSTHTLATTQAGEVMLHWARDIVTRETQLQEELQLLQATPKGRVRVAMDGLIATSYLPEMLAQFAEQYPAITVTAVLSENPPDALSEDCDLAIHAGPVPMDDLVGQRAYGYRRILCAAPAYLARHGQPSSLADLANHRCIGHVSSRDWAFTGPDGKLTTIAIDPAIEANSWLIVRNMALAGLGIVNMGGPLVDAHVTDGSLVRLLPEYEGVNPDGSGFGLWIVHANAKPAHRVRLFAQFAARYLRRAAPTYETSRSSELPASTG